MAASVRLLCVLLVGLLPVWVLLMLLMLVEVVPVEGWLFWALLMWLVRGLLLGRLVFGVMVVWVLLSMVGVLLVCAPAARHSLHGPGCHTVVWGH
jgi:hypothetical protein